MRYLLLLSAALSIASTFPVGSVSLLDRPETVESLSLWKRTKASLPQSQLKEHKTNLDLPRVGASRQAAVAPVAPKKASSSAGKSASRGYNAFDPSRIEDRNAPSKGSVDELLVMYEMSKDFMKTPAGQQWETDGAYDQWYNENKGQWNPTTRRWVNPRANEKVVPKMSYQSDPKTQTFRLLKEGDKRTSGGLIL